jgi:non-ribosomal peptide synthetase component F
MIADRQEEVFDLEKGPLTRVVVVSTSEQEHQLLVVAHHITTDGAGLGLLLAHLAEAYNALMKDARPAAPSGVQFRHYVEWERRLGESKAMQEALQYWQRELAGAPPRTQLAPVMPPAQAEPRGGTVRVEVSAREWRGLVELGRRHGATGFTTLLTVFYVWLHRYTGDDDLVVGTPYANREHADAKRLLGPLINTLPLRVTFDAEARAGSFAALLQRVRRTVLGGFRAAVAPTSAILAALKVPRAADHTPLFQVMFVLQPPASVPRFEGLASAPFREAGAALESAIRYDLTLSAEEPGAADAPLLVELEHRLDMIPRRKAARMAAHFGALVADVVARGHVADVPVLELRLMTAEEEQGVVVEPNQTTAKLPLERIVATFDRQATQRPDAVAVKFDGAKSTYAQLRLRAAQLLCEVQRALMRSSSAKAASQPLVLVCAARSVDLIAALLAVLAAGAAYVPIDPSTPAERCTAIAEDSQAAVLLTDEQQRKSKFGRFGGKVIDVRAKASDGDGDALSAWAKAVQQGGASCSEARLHNVIYTSGSTGKPKGVQVLECTAVNSLHDFVVALKLSEATVIVAHSSIGFDISTWELFAELIVGGHIVLAPDGAARDGTLMAQLLGEGTHVFLTPTGWRVLVESGWKGNPHLLGIGGGEAITADLLLKLQPLIKGYWVRCFVLISHLVAR